MSPPPTPASAAASGTHAPSRHVLPAAQRPVPSSAVPSQSSSAPLQDSAPGCAAVQLARAVPSHRPAHAPSPSQAGRPPRGVPVTATQVPTVPGSAQASQAPPQADSQQAPSTQWPLPHCAAPLQA